MDFTQLNYAAVGVAAGSAFLIGGLWYSPLLFVRPWMRLNGFDDESLKGGNRVKIFGGSFVFALIIALNLALFLGKAPGVRFGTLAGVAAGLGWVTASMGITALFERKPMALVAINGGFHVVSFAVMGAVLGAWP